MQYAPSLQLLLSMPVLILILLRDFFWKKTLYLIRAIAWLKISLIRLQYVNRTDCLILPSFPNVLYHVKMRLISLRCVCVIKGGSIHNLQVVVNQTLTFSMGVFQYHKMFTKLVVGLRILAIRGLELEAKP